MQPQPAAAAVPVLGEDLPAGVPLRPGGFGLRLAGRLLDTVFGFVVGAVAGVFAGIGLGLAVAAGALEQEALARVGELSLGSNLLWGLLAGFVSFVLWEWVAGTTPGKLVLGLRVVGEDLRPCSLRGAVTRSLAYFVDALFFGIPAYVSMEGTPRQQRLGDKWGKTVVARRSSLPPQALRSTGMLLAGLLAGCVGQFVVVLLSVLSRVL